MLVSYAHHAGRIRHLVMVDAIEQVFLGDRLDRFDHVAMPKKHLGILQEDEDIWIVPARVHGEPLGEGNHPARRVRTGLANIAVDIGTIQIDPDEPKFDQPVERR